MLSVCTCKRVSSFISEISHCLQKLLFSGEAVELPLCTGVSTVLGQTWNRNTSLDVMPSSGAEHLKKHSNVV